MDLDVEVFANKASFQYPVSGQEAQDQLKEFRSSEYFQHFAFGSIAYMWRKISIKCNVVARLDCTLTSYNM